MNTVLVECLTGLPRASVKGKREQYDKRIELRITPDKGANVRLLIDNIESRIVQDFSAVVLDLLELASYLYVADTAISRGRHDPLGERWYRDIELVVPVREHERWEEVRENLQELLTFLSGDAQIRLRFEPYSGKPHTGQRYIEFPSTDSGYKGAHTVVLFSGGIDSLAGVLREISARRVPLLVSHRSAAPRTSFQEGLLRQLHGPRKDKAYGLSMWINHIGEKQADVNQRLRSFVYLSLAFAVAKELGIHRILYCENGISSFNLPLSADRIGSRSSRTTNPRVLQEYQKLINKVLDHDAKVENPFLFLSKADVMEGIVAGGGGKLIADAVTCGRTVRVVRGSPNCGTCYQCTMRRFATEQRGLQEYDPPRVYAKDLFIQELKEGEQRGTPVQWVRFHNMISGLSDEDFEIRFPEIHDFYDYLPDDKSEALQKMFSLYRKNAEEVGQVLRRKHQDYFRQFMSGELPPHCLLSLIGMREHLQEPMRGYALRISGIAEKALRRSFAEDPPHKETAVQKQLEVVFEAAGERLRREYPTLVFSIVKTTPDFSSVEGRLFVEVKLLKDPKRQSQLVDALLADREKYTAAGASVLFLVYQTAPYIADPQEFIATLIRDGVFCKVVG